MARAIVFHRHGGPEVLRIEDIDTPVPGLSEVRIRVKALGLNRAEALIREGTYIETPTFPARLGLEASGIIDAVGAGVEGLSLGDAVSVIPPLSMTTYPTHGEFAVLPAGHIVKHPANLGWEEAAAVWMPFLTAYGALVDLAQLRPASPLSSPQHRAAWALPRSRLPAGSALSSCAHPHIGEAAGFARRRSGTCDRHHGRAASRAAAADCRPRQYPGRFSTRSAGRWSARFQMPCQKAASSSNMAVSIRCRHRFRCLQLYQRA